MLSQIYQYVGTAALITYDLPFDPVVAFVIPDGATYPTIYANDTWVQRSISFGASDSIVNGVRFIGRKLLIGTAAQVNTSGAKYKVVVLGGEAGDLTTASWCGNATAGHVVSVDNGGQAIAAAIIKRDSTLPPVLKLGSYATTFADGTTATDCVALGSGQVTLTAAAAVNEWVPATGVGEGILGLFATANAVKVGQYTGTGAARTVDVGCDASLVIIHRTDGTTSARMFVRGTASTLGKTTDASAASAAGTLIGGVLSLASATGNASGASYNYIAFKHRPVSANQSYLTQRQAPAIRVGGKKALSFLGRGAAGNVDFGTGLNINGAITLTWLGSIPGDQGQGATIDGVMLAKINGAYGGAGAASWGIMAPSMLDNSKNWSGPHACAILGGTVSYSDTLTSGMWRSGLVVPMGIHHHAFVYRSNGAAEWYMDGKLVRQRLVSTDSIASNASHKVQMGSRWNGSAYVNPARMLALRANVYSRDLSASEIATLHAIERLGASASADVTSGLAERWDASNINAAATTWTAQVDNANNVGTITGGHLLEL